jgi:hypothetical protein
MQIGQTTSSVFFLRAFLQPSISSLNAGPDGPAALGLGPLLLFHSLSSVSRLLPLS